jgi:glycosyltransferase involved in cell wall biosynthesis
MKLKNLSVFFPAYNEQHNITRTVEKALEIIPSVADNFEIIVINDGSSDKTGERLEELSKRYGKIKVITHEQNRGYGAALKSGFANSQYEYIFYTDGDGQFDIREIKKLAVLMEQCDIAAGFRLKRKDSFYRVFNGKAYSLLISLLFGFNIKDVDCAFKIVKKKVVSSIDLKSNGAFISAEFLIRAKRKGFVIKQCGVGHLPRKMGKPTGNNPLVILRAFRDLFKLWKELK